MEIEWDLESTPLEIRTSNVLGSEDVVFVALYSDNGHGVAGQIYLRFFTSTLQYYIHLCLKDYANFPVNPPSANDKVWRITLTKTADVRLVIHCNEVEVLNTLISQATCIDSSWSTYWNRDVTTIKLISDTANYYRAQPGNLHR